jgi:thiol-disulfide isomerase/thioredoxin
MKLKTLLCLAVLVSGCPAPRVTKPAAPDKAVQARIEAILINGGHQHKSNYHSHLVHLRRLARLLRAAGVERQRITIMASDGPNPAADLAVREPGQFQDHWLIQGTEPGSLLGPPVMQINSTVAGMRLLPAKKATLQAWFQLRAGELKPGDTLLIHVTDHGFRGDEVNPDATIALWGEKLPVADLVAFLDELDPRVRVILWMSQCYSGAFARAIYRKDGGLRGNVCGFFSTTAERVAWGCYPEARDDHQGLGHSMRFLDELHPGASLGRAHDRVLITDRTPDVPHRASDYFLADLVKPDRADALLEEAWKQPGRWSRQLETIDRLARRAGLKPPRFLKDLTAIEARLKKHRGRSRTYKKRWSECLRDLRRFNMTSFTADRQVWQAKTLEGLLKKHGHSFGTAEEDEQARVGLIEKLISEFKAFIEKDAGLNRRLSALHEKRGRAADINLRLQVRQGILLRIRTILRSVAGEVLAAKNPGHREELRRLRACEDFALPGEPPPPAAARPEPPALPALADDLEQLDAVRPAWLGVRYGPEHPSLQEKHKLGAGAVVVRSVVAGSAAEEAGILRGDTIAGTPGRPFREPGALRELVMLAKPDQQVELEIIRRGKRRTVKVRLHPFPDQVPRLPDKPVAGQDAPPLLDLVPLRGKLPPPNSPVLLVFFSTWCGPCKQAYQPLVEWERQHNIPVVLVSSESEELVEEFLARWTKPMPGRVALDPRGLVTDSFSAGKYPTFVLVSKQGKIQAVQQGYSESRGLKMP